MPKFGIGKIIDCGADHPVVKRILLQYHDILRSNMLTLSKDTISTVRQLLFKCMLDLLNTEESAAAYISLEDNATIALTTRMGSNGLGDVCRFDDPTEDLLDLFADFLTRAVVVIRDINRIGNVVLGIKSRDLRYLREAVAKLVEPNDLRIQRLQADKIWVDRLYFLRGKAEHEELDVTRFDIKSSTDGQAYVQMPFLSDDNIPIRDYIRTTYNDLVLFAEDTLAILLDLKCDDIAYIQRIPAQLRPEYCGYTYNIWLKAIAGLEYQVRTENPSLAQIPPKSEDKSFDSKEKIKAVVPYRDGLAIVTTKQVFYMTESEFHREGGYFRIFG